jgi:hypothetical protein
MTEMRTKNNEAAAGKKRPNICRLDSRQDVPETLTDEQADAARGGITDRSVTPMLRMNKTPA